MELKQVKLSWESHRPLLVDCLIKAVKLELLFSKSDDLAIACHMHAWNHKITMKWLRKRLCLVFVTALLD